GWATGCRASCCGFDSTRSNSLCDCFSGHKLICRVWVSCEIVHINLYVCKCTHDTGENPSVSLSPRARRKKSLDDFSLLKFYYLLHFDISSVTLTVNTNQTTLIKLKSIESFRLESGQFSNLAPKISHFDFFIIFIYPVSLLHVTLTVNTNLTTPLKSKSIKPFRLQSVPNNYTYIHTYIHTLEKHNPPSGAVG
ncbi:hypothetical protein SFRURICE_004814, partial [Spodoptera frugiperda]